MATLADMSAEAVVAVVVGVGSAAAAAAGACWVAVTGAGARGAGSVTGEGFAGVVDGWVAEGSWVFIGVEVDFFWVSSEKLFFCRLLVKHIS